MSPRGQVTSVNISEQVGTVKHPVSQIIINDQGVIGDAHAGTGRQVSLLAQESIDAFVARTGRKTSPGDFAENITLTGLNLTAVAPLDRFRIGKVELEVIQIGKKCHGDGCAIFREVGQCVMPTEGLFCRVKSPGKIQAGHQILYLPKKVNCLIITLSDRAFAGQYADKSGPRAQQLLEEFLSATPWPYRIQSALLPDQADKLRQKIQEALDQAVDLIFTLGGTGIGPRDITPQTVAPLCDKIIPGIMENIRLKSAAQKPSALLSRGIAGLAGSTQIYTLPGSVRAVEEYLAEIFKTLEHALLMIHGLDVHRHSPHGQAAAQADPQEPAK